jgi:hypothetical protein
MSMDVIEVSRHVSDEHRCFCGAPWNRPASECAAGHRMDPRDAELARLRAENERLTLELAARIADIANMSHKLASARAVVDAAVRWREAEQAYDRALRSHYAAPADEHARVMRGHEDECEAAESDLRRLAAGFAAKGVVE